MKFLVLILTLSFSSVSFSHEIAMRCSSANWHCPDPNAFGCGWWMNPSPLEPMILKLVQNVEQPEKWTVQHVAEDDGYKVVVNIEAQITSETDAPTFRSEIVMSKELAIAESRGFFDPVLNNVVSINLRYAESGFSYTCTYKPVTE